MSAPIKCMSFRSLPQKRQGFSLVEMMVALLILTMIMGVVLGITSQVGKTWKATTSKVDSFAGARIGFDVLTRKLRQATLNPYYDYFDSAGNRLSGTGVPSLYGRQSELHFISSPSLVASQKTHAIFFQAPLGLSSDNAYTCLASLVNACGYWISFTDESRPSFLTGILPSKKRFRLMEYNEDAKDLSVYRRSGTAWINPNSANSSPLADNILALIVVPRLASEQPANSSLVKPPIATGNYIYDSRRSWSGITQPIQMNQLPPVVHIVMVAADEASLARLLENVSDEATAVSKLGLDDVYRNRFQNPLYLETDLTAMEDALDGKKISYRVFRTDVMIRGAKWSN